MKIRQIIYILTFWMLCSPLRAQVLDEETGFIYVKAEYLFETGRYEEAITNYNAVISRDPKYKDALIHRGQSKYALAAYKGSKMDAIQSIEIKGITAEAAGLLGRSFAAMNEIAAGINTLTAAIALDNKNSQYYEWRAGMYESDQQLLKACNDYESAMNLGSAGAENKAKILCGISKSKPSTSAIPKKDPQVVDQEHKSEQDNTTKPSSNPNPDELGQNEVLSSGTQESDPSSPTKTEENDSQVKNDTTIIDDSDPVHDENTPKNDDSVNSFVIDEDLTISISGQELGQRKIKEVPSILILADENGKVTVNICVNKEGVVTKAEFNGTMSTIAKKSLVSLALRKAKEFEFMTGKYDLQCGTMVFNIKGS